MVYNYRMSVTIPIPHGERCVKSGFITCKSFGAYGRFMNQGWQLAGILGIGRKNNLEPCFPLWQNTDHRDRFGSREDIDIYKHLVHELPSIPEGLSFQDRTIDWGYWDVQLPSGNWNLTGHFQSPKYFSHCLDTVRHYLRLKDEGPQTDYIGLHVRLGDYDNAYHPRLDMRYYSPAMAQFKGARFLAFSDDIPACKEMFGNKVEYSEGLDYIQDFKRLKRCSHFIIGNSSYSAMAAILGEYPGKKVIAPRPWFGPKYTEITGEDIYSPDWQIINW